MNRKSIIGIVHNEPVSNGQAYSEASSDVLAQVEAIESVLKEAEYPAVRVPFTKDVGAFVRRMQEEKVEMAFNLCETVDEDARYVAHPAAVLELMNIPFSGSPSMALMLTTDKLVTKRLLRAKGIRTSEYLVYDGSGAFQSAALKFPVIVKPRYEDASIGIDQESIFRTREELCNGIPSFCERFGSVLVEEYVGGREFNISLFGYPMARALPIAEIEFREFPEGLFPIVGYRAKWDKDSFEYQHTLRAFPGDLPPPVLASIESAALECFRLFMLRDYGRVDIRVDESGRINVLEVNANCCLSPDAGFSAAIERAGTSYSKMVTQLLEFMEQRSGAYDNQACQKSRQTRDSEAAYTEKRFQRA